MFVKNGLVVNIYSPYTAPNGTQYHNLLDPGIRTHLGIEEIPDPEAPADYSEDFYYRTEQLAEPYVIYTRKSDEQILQIMKNKFLQAVQARLDDEARTKGYDSILSACSYAGAANPFQAESQSFIVWRREVWTCCYTELLKVENGTRPMPTVAEFLAELPNRTEPI